MPIDLSNARQYESRIQTAIQALPICLNARWNDLQVVYGQLSDAQAAQGTSATAWQPVAAIVAEAVAKDPTNPAWVAAIHTPVMRGLAAWIEEWETKRPKTYSTATLTWLYDLQRHYRKFVPA